MHLPCLSVGWAPPPLHPAPPNRRPSRQVNQCSRNNQMVAAERYHRFAQFDAVRCRFLFLSEVLELRFVLYSVYAHTPTTVWTDFFLFIYVFFILVRSLSTTQ